MQLKDGFLPLRKIESADDALVQIQSQQQSDVTQWDWLGDRNHQSSNKKGVCERFIPSRKHSKMHVSFN